MNKEIEEAEVIKEMKAVQLGTDGEGAGDAIRKAVIEGRYEAAVDACIVGGQYAVALMLAQQDGERLYQKVGKMQP